MKHKITVIRGGYVSVSAAKMDIQNFDDGIFQRQSTYWPDPAKFGCKLLGMKAKARSCKDKQPYNGAEIVVEMTFDGTEKKAKGWHAAITAAWKAYTSTLWKIAEPKLEQAEDED